MVPSDREVSMKKVAAAFGGKSAKMASPADAERITGFKVGGVSPFGRSAGFPPPSMPRPWASPMSWSTPASADCRRS